MNLQSSTTFRELPLEFIGQGETKGYDYKQLFTDGKWYIYQVSTEGIVSHYEVFQRKEVLAATAKYAKENYVAYPRSNAFGLYAWTAKTLDQAKDIIQKH